MKVKRIFLLALVLALLCSQAGIVSAEGEQPSAVTDGGDVQTSADAGTDGDTDADAEVVVSDDNYIAYEKENGSLGLAKDEVLLQGEETTLKAGDTLEYAVEVPADGLYELTLEFISRVTANTVVSLQIDGVVPFAEAQRLQFPNGFINKEGSVPDAMGNESAPEQILDPESVVRSARDYTGISTKPYRFVLTAGTHTIVLKATQGEILLKKAAFTAPEVAPTYADVMNGKTPNFTGKPIVLEGEKAVKKNSRALIPLSNGSSTAVYPADPVKSLLNYIGGTNWQSPGSELTWNFDVEESGYYYLGIQYRQSAVIGGVSYRHLKIDGKTPFKEAEELKFTYDNAWNYWKFQDEDKNNYWFYLEAGSHTVTLTVNPGPVAQVYADLQNVVAALGDLYVDITMVVGETVDIYRSYNLFEQIPRFQERLMECATELDRLTDVMSSLQGSKSSQAATLENMAETLRQMHGRPYTAHRYKGSFYTNYTTLSATVMALTNMPLDVDRIYFMGGEDVVAEDKTTWYGDLWFSIRRLAATFSEDYNKTGSDSESDDTLVLWVNWGRDQAQTLDSLIRNEFVPKHGIDVSVRVTNATLIQGMLSGDGPDMVLQMGRTDPVNYAMRGALVNLEKFDDFEEWTKQFVDGACVPYQYREGTYAIPDTQGFYVQYVRTDLFEEMGLEIPKTWDDFVYVTTILQRKNLQASLPYSPSIDGGLYTTLLLQNNLDLFKEDLSGTLMTETPQIQVFEKWTTFYTKYKIPTTMDFYNRFRIGSAPLGVASYSLYNQIKVAAPELEGRWTIAPLPGTLQEDGTINNKVAGSGTACGITKLAKANEESAWTFLKWWTSANTQAQYSSRLESLLGAVGRSMVANKEALPNLGWDIEALKVLEAQREQIIEMPEVPGSYYVSRGIDQGFWNAVEQSANVTDTMLKWGAIVDREIQRKTDEYKDKYFDN